MTTINISIKDILGVAKITKVTFRLLDQITTEGITLAPNTLKFINTDSGGLATIQLYRGNYFVQVDRSIFNISVSGTGTANLVDLIALTPQESLDRGVPSGGDANQVLGKLSSNDFDFDWIDQSGGGSVATDLTYTPSPTQGQINSSTGADAVIPPTDETNAGLFLPGEKAKLAITNIKTQVIETNVGAGSSVQSGYFGLDGEFGISRLVSKKGANVLQIVNDGNADIEFWINGQNRAKINKTGVAIDSNDLLTKADIDNNITYITTKSDLPSSVAGIITLQPGNYMITNHIDLTGDRLVMAGDTVLFGASSETASITSTGLTGNPLITSIYDLPMRNLEIRNVPTAVNLVDNTGTKALDWTAVNFINCQEVGLISGYSNFVQSFSVFINCGKLRFEGSIGTVSFDSTLWSGVIGKALEFATNFVSLRRIRIVFSAINVTGSNIFVDLPTTATVNANRFIIFKSDFSGGGQYLSATGVQATDNKAQFDSNTGIDNSSTLAYYTMQNNATATVIGALSTPIKVAGTTVNSTLTQKFTHTNNRVTYTGAINESFKVNVNLSLSSGNNNEVGVYVAKNGVEIDESETYLTTNSGGKVENGFCQLITNLSQGDYIEVWVENATAINNITVEFLSVIVSKVL